MRSSKHTNRTLSTAVGVSVTVATAAGAETGLEVIRFVCFDDRTLAAYQARLG